MQKFSEFLNEYKTWKKENKGTSKLSSKEVKNIREAYASLESKKARSLKESTKKTSEFGKMVKDYASFKESKNGSKVVTKEEKIALHKEFLKMKEAKLQKSKKIKDFSEFVTSYREWKKTNYGSSKLNEAEKKSLKESFFNKNSKAKLQESKSTKSAVMSAKAKRFEEAINDYAEWKSKNQGTSKISEAEKVEVMKGLLLEDIKSKVAEAKKFTREARKHLIEGDLMDAGGAAQTAGDTINTADAMAGQAAMGDAMVPAQEIPQAIVDEIANIKASVDTLATEIGIQSPVDLGADPNAGIPATTGVADPNADMAMAADAPMADPNAAMVESTISTIKSRLAAREEKLNEGKTNLVFNAEDEAINNNPNLTAPRADVDKKNSEDTMPVPSTKEILNGTKKGEIAAAKTWPTEKITDPADKKLKNIEESEVSETESKIAESLDENGAFNWDNFLKANENLYK